MNSYRVEFSREAERSLRDLPNDACDRILERINELASNPICEKELKGRLRGLCQARVGDYRIIYQNKPYATRHKGNHHRQAGEYL